MLENLIEPKEVLDKPCIDSVVVKKAVISGVMFAIGNIANYFDFFKKLKNNRFVRFREHTEH